MVPSVSNYRFGTSLGDGTFVFDVHWNERAESYYLDVLTFDAVPIRTGMRLNLGRLVGVESADPRMPDGEFIVADLSGEGAEATFSDMGERVVVFFYSREELEELGAV